MTLEVELVLLEPGDIELLARGAALQLSRDVLLVITDDPVKLALVFQRIGKTVLKSEETYLVMMPVVLTPSVRCVTKNLPSFLIGA